ncbi:MAG TPA: hypothetical protein VFK80_00850, partial [Limnochordia bacterium]|nr:hypothetical protein [Limnochordia bacterium]
MPSAVAAASTGVAASIRLSIWAAAFFNFSVALTSDLFLHGFAIKVLGVSDVQLALMVSLPAACGFVQLISPYLIEWLGSRKGAVLSSIGAGALVWLLIPLLALGRDR